MLLCCLWKLLSSWFLIGKPTSGKFTKLLINTENHIYTLLYFRCRMGYQQPGQQSFQGGATHSSQVAAVQKPWDTDYNPYQQYAYQVS